MHEVVAAHEDARGESTHQERLTQVFRIEGLPGVVMHVRLRETGSSGAVLVHVHGGNASRVGRGERSGNG